MLVEEGGERKMRDVETEGERKEGRGEERREGRKEREEGYKEEGEKIGVRRKEEERKESEWSQTHRATGPVIISSLLKLHLAPKRLNNLR